MVHAPSVMVWVATRKLLIRVLSSLKFIYHILRPVSSSPQSPNNDPLGSVLKVYGENDMVSISQSFVNTVNVLRNHWMDSNAQKRFGKTHGYGMERTG
ncbi:hypothetical protein TNCV_3990161 [Trichonephila clavipes]|uniref:Uncharacterized protein n=1 Tax=Trichonephila clavipes TaxID=2585209 RepID=A0A8X6SVS6_TRICX|nr:hypothetical protein TNCV_3990161 [Trichonephila clavipes]